MKLTSFKSDRLALKTQQPRLIPYYLGHFMIYLGCLLLVLVGGWLAFKGQRLYSHYHSALGHLAYLKDLRMTDPAAPAPPEPAQLYENVQGLARSLEGLHEEAQPFLPLVRYFVWLPVYGDELQAVPSLLTVARDMGRTGALLSKTLEPAFEAEAEQADFLPLLVTRLAEMETDLAQAEAALQQDQAAIKALERADFSPALAHGVDQLRRYLPQLISGVQVARAVPSLFGTQSPQTYLILTQNSDELRPSGGYITTAGHIVFDQGRIVEFVMQDSYRVDKLSSAYPYPPAPLYQYMAADYWVLRDASWSPDFPSAAQAAADLYQLGQGVSPDGVIAFDQQALAYLLRAFEPVSVEEEQVTGSNVITLMRQHWAPEQGQALDQAWWLERKSFMVSLGEALRAKFEQGLELKRLPLLLESLTQALQEKHLLMTLKTPELAGLVKARNWDGGLRSEAGDYLMVTNANVGFNKASALVEQYLSYQVVLSREGSAQVHAQLIYQHTAPHQPGEGCSQEPQYEPVYEQNMIRCYWNYLRLIVPAEAQLLRGPQTRVAGAHLLRGQPTSGAVDVGYPAAGKMSWGQLFLLPPGEAVAVDYLYTLPEGTVHKVGDYWQYNLYLQKQAGTLAPKVELIVILPEGAQLKDSLPLPTSQTQNKLNYQLNLKTDQPLHLSYSLP